VKSRLGQKDPQAGAVMKNPGRNPDARRSAFTLIELVVVLTIAGVLGAMAIPRMTSLSLYRADAAAQQVRSVFITAQRTSLTRQYDVIVSVDTIRGGLRIAEDMDNSGTITSNETRFWRPPGEGNRFSRPTFGVNVALPGASVYGSSLKQVDNLPSIVFHRDGSASSDAEVYMSSTYRSRVDFRAITLVRSTGRADLYRLAGTGTNAHWEVVQ
jgi:prepilin-type N-terminal cleavage/methylation domain-containing protein